MKIFHLSDLHIGFKLYNKDLTKDQDYVFDQVYEYAKNEKPDVIIVAGDIYDHAIPSAEANGQFDRFLTNLMRAQPDAEIMMVSGNHDNAMRINMFRSILKNEHVHMIGVPPMKEHEYIEKVTLEDAYGNVNFYLLPFIKPTMVKQIVGTEDNGNNLSYDESMRRLIARENIDTNMRNVFVSHQLYLPNGKKSEDIERMDSEIFRTVGNIDEIHSDVLEVFDYAALGHIHKPMKVGSEYYRYCGTPLAYSFSEENQEKGIILVELNEKGNIKTSVLPLKPLHPMRTIQGKFEDLIKDYSEDYIRIILTDDQEFDLFDMQDRLYNSYPNHLEVRRIRTLQEEQVGQVEYDEALSPYDLCTSFLKDMNEDEEEMLKDVFEKVGGTNA